MKNGLIEENGKLIYYKDDKPVHAGLIKIDGAIYYIGTGGVAVTGKHTVHTSMANGILKHGVYTFSADGKLKEGSYVPLQRRTKRSHKSQKSHQIAKRLLLVGGILLLALLFVGFGFLFDEIGNASGTPVQTTEASDVKIKLPDFTEEVVLTSQEALDVYYGELSILEARAKGKPYRSLVFEYKLYGQDGVLSYSENADLSNAVQVSLDGTKTSVEIDNLKTGTTYYYKVALPEKTFTGSFKTAASTRFIEVDSLFNARDIGGYTTLDGKTVKQGMIIRGAELDGLVAPSYRVASEKLAYMQETFEFVYEMDLRSSNIFPNKYSSLLGEGVEHKFYGSPQYGEIFDTTYKTALNSIFSDLAKEENYPMYMHCAHGADRTGTVIFLLQAILNMSEEEMIREYQRTGFAISSYATADTYEIILTGLNTKEGATLQEKVARFLIDDIGITKEQIRSIQNILLQ